MKLLAVFTLEILVNRWLEVQKVVTLPPKKRGKPTLLGAD